MSTDLDTARPDQERSLPILNPYSGRDARDDYEDALATISAGYRVGDGPQYQPRASIDGTIYLHDPDGRAPGLAAALDATGKKSLTVAFLADDPERIVSQRFMAYSASRLLAYGDEQRITHIRWKDDGDEKKGFERVLFERGTDEYERARAKCKVYASVYWALSRYDPDGQPEVLFPDGLGFYRLRTTSLNSLRALRASLQNVRRLTNGRLRGIPFELSIGYREVARPNGRKTRIPVWQAILRPPEGIVLGSRTFAVLAQAGLQEGRMLALPAPSDALIEAEAYREVEWADSPDSGDVPEPPQAEAELVARGGRCDAAYWLARWHATAAGSRYADDEERHHLIVALTRGRYASLRTFLADATEQEAAQLVMTLEQAKAADAAEPEAEPTEDPEWPSDAEWHDAADAAESEPVADEEPYAPPSDDENLAGMARKAVHAFAETFRKEDGAKPPSPALVRAWRRFVEEELRCDPAPLLPYLVGKHAGELTAAEMRAVMSWGGGPDAPDQVAAIMRLGAPKTVVPS